MAEKNAVRKVYVEVSTNVVVAQFGKKREANKPADSSYYVSVELEESELQLKGELFVAVVRRALTRAFGQDKKVMVYRGGSVTPSSISQILGFMMPPETVKITDRWHEPA